MDQAMKTEPDKFFQMRTSESFLRDVDALRRRESDLPSRADMVRRLVERALQSGEPALLLAKRAARSKK